MKVVKTEQNPYTLYDFTILRLQRIEKFVNKNIQEINFLPLKTFNEK